MANRGRSEKGLFGTVYHYDENGRKTGRSEPGLFGGYTNYDAKGNKTGYSDPGFFGDYKHYDNQGKKTGSSEPGLFGGYTHYDNQREKIGSSDPGFFDSYHHNGSKSTSTGSGDSGSYSNNDSQGCYVATCVYGSYDCPQVWVLRRFRDYSLAKTLAGRLFIKLYYTVSPTLVKWFGNTKQFKSFWGKVLDKMVLKLMENGVEDTPYNDK